MGWQPGFATSFQLVRIVGSGPYVAEQKVSDWQMNAREPRDIVKDNITRSNIKTTVRYGG